jgi:hypothetical protein
MKKILLMGFALVCFSSMAFAQTEPSKAKKKSTTPFVAKAYETAPASAERVKAKLEKEKNAAKASTPATINAASETVPKKTDQKK